MEEDKEYIVHVDIRISTNILVTAESIDAAEKLALELVKEIHNYDADPFDEQSGIHGKEIEVTLVEIIRDE